MANTTTLAASTGELAFTDGQLEALKWVALASMFVDHFGRHLLGYGQDTWVFALGRVAFPLFALVLALNLAREGDRAARALRTAKRLARWCLVSILPSIWARGDPMVVNVLATLGLGAALCWTLASAARLPLRLAVASAAAVASLHVEFGLPGAFLIPAIFLWRTEPHLRTSVLAALLLASTAWLNASFGGGMAAVAGTLASAPIAWCVRRVPVPVPRLQLAFYVVYPLHLALIGALKSSGWTGT